MWPEILGDLVAGQRDKAIVENLTKQASLLRQQHRQDSVLLLGTVGQTRRIETLIDSSARGWQMADYWRKRYKKASTERWLFRIGAAGTGGWFIYDKILRPK